MKFFVVSVLVILALVGVSLFIAQTLRDGENTDVVTENVTDTYTMPVTGTVVRTDLEQVMVDGPAIVVLKTEDGREATIAIPSMGLPLCAAYDRVTGPGSISIGDIVTVSGSIDEEGRIVPCENPSDYLEVTSVYANTEIGFAFEYEKGQQGYVFEDDLPGFSEHEDFLYGIMLTETSEYEAFQNSTDAREGPPTIQIHVFENTQKLSPSVWADRNPLASNIELAFGDPEEAVVGGANATHYIADGLYATDTYVVAHGGYIFIILGMYLDENSEIARDFTSIVDSVTFIPTPEQLEGGA